MSGPLVLRILGYLLLMGAVLLLLTYLGMPWRQLPGRLWTWLQGLLTRPELATARVRLGGALERFTPAERFRAYSRRESYDPEHAQRLGELARRLGEAAGLTAEALEGLVEAAWWHDAGLAELASELARSEPLPPELRARLVTHPLVGAELAAEHARHPETPWWVRWHHERVDGTGYPDGLVAEEIPLPARVLALADAYEALTHPRPYRSALSPADALAELGRQAGMQHDAELVRLFAQVVWPEISPLHGRGEEGDAPGRA